MDGRQTHSALVIKAMEKNKAGKGTGDHWIAVLNRIVRFLLRRWHLHSNMKKMIGQSYGSLRKECSRQREKSGQMP